MSKIIILLFTLVLCFQGVSAEEESKNISLGDQLENLGRLYKDDTNKLMQEFWLLGRYHGHYHWSEGNVGEDDGYESRRIRAGFQGKFFEKLTVHAQAISGSDFNPTYNGFTELWLQWAFSPEIVFAVGQQKNRFTHDRNASSRYLNYLERGMLTNMFGVDYTPAVTLQGKVDNNNYYTGLFTNATSDDMVDSFTEFDSGYTLLFANYYDAKEHIPLDTAYIHFSMVHSEPTEKATNFKRFKDAVSTALIVTKNSTSLITELMIGRDTKKGNAYGVNIQPGYFLTKKVQLVSRYQLAVSSNSDGLNPQSRYEREAGVTKGDFYQAAYGGIDYYIAKHRMKFLVGLEYANMNGEYVWTASSMVRLFFGPHSGGAFPMNVVLPGGFFVYD